MLFSKVAVIMSFASVLSSLKLMSLPIFVSILLTDLGEGASDDDRVVVEVAVARNRIDIEKYI